MGAGDHREAESLVELAAFLVSTDGRVEGNDVG